MPTYTVLPLSLNSQCIFFTDWISLLTLCLAPLLTHVIAGSPSVSYLTDSQPPWYERIVHYNPTSILWRYAAITDRRLRAVSWDRTSLAATNAIFWTSSGWRGGEEMVQTADPYCCRLPMHSHVDIASTTTLKTVITTAQGASAIYLLLRNMSGVDEYSVGFVGQFGVDSIFAPLAFFGLLRLCAAAWLTDDYTFVPRDMPVGDISMKPLPSRTPSGYDVLRQASGGWASPTVGPTGHFKPTSHWRSRVFRGVYLILVLLFWAICVFFIAPISSDRPADELVRSTTMFLVSLFYTFLLTITAVVYVYYFHRGRTTTTIIPCISSWWYRAYTILFMMFTVVLIVVAGIETQRTSQGGYSSLTWKPAVGCNPWSLSSGMPASPLYGLVSLQSNLTGGTEVWQPSLMVNTTDRPIWIYNFTGWCHAIES